ncbi:MAG: hypothetical protein JWM05_1063, partial [Acidimicrobiales bacterium]|nr:hypothetical protein [Acidimicrobiales bacterium]
MPTTNHRRPHASGSTSTRRVGRVLGGALAGAVAGALLVPSLASATEEPKPCFYDSQVTEGPGGNLQCKTDRIGVWAPSRLESNDSFAQIKTGGGDVPAVAWSGDAYTDDLGRDHIVWDVDNTIASGVDIARTLQKTGWYHRCSSIIQDRVVDCR